MPSDRTWDVLTFDCYGTLIDWEGGIGRAFEEAATRAGRKIDRTLALGAYAEHEPKVQASGYQSYRSVLMASASIAATLQGWQLPDSEADFLPRSVPFWRPFDDSNGALVRLKQAGYELGLLTNVDDDLLRETLKHFDVEFDFTITAEQVRAYKPFHAHFMAAKDRVGDRPWLHCAQSYFHDVVPAALLGLPVAWINRKHERASGPLRPDFQFDDLDQLANHLT